MIPKKFLIWFCQFILANALPYLRKKSENWIPNAGCGKTFQTLAQNDFQICVKM